MKPSVRGPLLLIVAGLAAFLTFVLLGGEPDPRPSAPVTDVSSDTEPAPVAAEGTAGHGGALPDQAQGPAATKPPRAPATTKPIDALAEEGGDGAGQGGGGTVGFEGAADGGGAAGLPLTGSLGRALRAILGSPSSGAPGATGQDSRASGGATGSTIASPDGASGTGTAGGAADGGAAKKEDGPLTDCKKPIINKAVFDLEQQPEMRSAFDAAYRQASLGGSRGYTFGAGGGSAYLLQASVPGTMEAGAIFDSKTLVIVRGKCLQDAGQLTAALVP